MLGVDGLQEKCSRPGRAQTETVPQHLIEEFLVPRVSFSKQKILGMQPCPHVRTIDLTAAPTFGSVVRARHLHDELDIDLHHRHVHMLGFQEEEEGEQMAVGRPVMA